MGLYHTEDQTMLKDSVAPFLAENGSVKHLRQIRDSKDPIGFARDLWSQFAEMGLNGILIPEAEGGLGLGHVEAGIVLEEIGKNLTPSPFLSTAVAAVEALKSASADLRGQWFPKIAAGEAVIGLALEEGKKHNPAATALKAERSGNGFKLTGAKTFVVHGHVADMLLVSARTAGSAGEETGITLFAVPRDAAGLTSEADRLVDSSMSARVNLDGVQVDADAVVGEVDAGWAPLTALLNAGRLGASAELVGVGTGAMGMTFDYLKQRKQFGKVIGEFQALQHRAAHLYGEMEGARSIVLKAQQMLDDGDPRGEMFVSAAKAKAGKATNLAVREGVQMHGGIGMTDEYDIGLYMKRDRALNEVFGDVYFHADKLAKMNGY